MNGLTLKQEEILGFLRLFVQQNSYWPSIREIQEHFNFRSTNAVAGHLRALEKKGAITHVPGQARAYRLTVEPSGKLPEDASEVIDIPVYGSIAAGYPEGVEQGDAIDRIQIDLQTAGVRSSARTFALKVRGESMINAGIHEGDTVILDTRMPRHGDVVAALIDGETTLKRFIQKNQARPYLRAENPDYPDIHPVSELVIQGVATAVVRKL
ncbi:MAG: repressor LexA [Opitutales bacterium]|nr:repressor LexA [Opitutales bacterium]MCH8539701.1 transcriptional repressor LexA [Opitutales bacterium]